MAKRKKSTTKTLSGDKIDRGTIETRRRMSADPLLSSTLEPHRAAAGIAIRTALEEGLGAKGLDIVRIGMGGGASGGYHHPTPTERLMRSRYALGQWRIECGRRGLHASFAEDFALGNSIRQIAQHHILSRHRVTDLVHVGLDLYADMLGYRRQASPSPSIAVWEDQSCHPSVTDGHIYAAPPRAALKNRNLIQ